MISNPHLATARHGTDETPVCRAPYAGPAAGSSQAEGPPEVADGDLRFVVVDPIYKIRAKKRRATDETGAHGRDRAVPFGSSGESLGLVGLGPLGAYGPIGEERMKRIGEGPHTNVQSNTTARQLI
jgi:hypothetical protein